MPVSRGTLLTNPHRTLLIGDSLTVGRGAGSGPLGLTGARAYSPANILSRLTPGVSAESVVGLGGRSPATDLPSYDLRVGVGEWSRLDTMTAIGGDTFYADDLNAGVLRFEFGSVDNIILGLPNRLDGNYGTVRWRVDGGPWTEHVEDTATGFGRLDRVDVLSSGTLGSHIVEVESVEPVRNTFVQYCEAWSSADSQVMIPWGSRGLTSADLLASSRPWTYSGALGEVPFDSVILGIGMNDVSTGVLPVVFETNVRSYVASIRVANPSAQVTLVVPLERQGGLGFLPQSLQNLSVELGCSLIDLRNAEGLSNYAESVLSGGMSDTVHPSREGYLRAWEYAHSVL